MKVLRLIAIALVETLLIMGSLFIFDEEPILFCGTFIFLLIAVPLVGYYIVKEKKPIWILIILILLLPLSYLVNMGVVKIQESSYQKEMNALVEDNNNKAQEMTDSLKALIEKGDIKGLKEIYTEEAVDDLTNKFDLKKIKFEKFGEDLEIEPYDTESWGGVGTGSFTYDGTKYYIEYSLTGTKDEANYSDLTILPYDLYEKASNLTDESDADEADKIYEEIDKTQVYLESIYSIENQDIDSLMDLEE